METANDGELCTGCYDVFPQADLTKHTTAAHDGVRLYFCPPCVLRLGIQKKKEPRRSSPAPEYQRYVAVMGERNDFAKSLVRSNILIHSSGERAWFRGMVLVYSPMRGFQVKLDHIDYTTSGDDKTEKVWLYEDGSGTDATNGLPLKWKRDAPASAPVPPAARRGGPRRRSAPPPQSSVEATQLALGQLAARLAEECAQDEAKADAEAAAAVAAAEAAAAAAAEAKADAEAAAAAAAAAAVMGTAADKSLPTADVSAGLTTGFATRCSVSHGRLGQDGEPPARLVGCSHFYLTNGGPLMAWRDAQRSCPVAGCPNRVRRTTAIEKLQVPNAAAVLEAMRTHDKLYHDENFNVFLPPPAERIAAVIDVDSARTARVVNQKRMRPF